MASVCAASLCPARLGKHECRPASHAGLPLCRPHLCLYIVLRLRHVGLASQSPLCSKRPNLHLPTPYQSPCILAEKALSEALHIGRDLGHGLANLLLALHVLSHAPATTRRPGVTPSQAWERRIACGHLTLGATSHARALLGWGNGWMWGCARV